MSASEEVPSLGVIHPKGTLFLKQAIGTAAAGDAFYEVYSIIPTCTPLIVSKQTGKSFVLGWQDIIDLAQRAGIDSKDSGKEQA